jgi:hypothetical protein
VYAPGRVHVGVSPSVRRRRPPKNETYLLGPWKGVRSTTDPGDDPPDILVDATNGYIPDPGGGSGFYARPGFRILNNGTAIVVQVTPFRGQGVFAYTSLAGVTTNFIVMAGKLFRVDGQLATFTDVTPAGITIDPAIATRVYAKQLGTQFVISDGVNRPWLASNLTATPITGTNIQFNAANDLWSAFGKPTVYAGSFLFVLNTVAGVYARDDFAWSIAGDASQGYQQTNYDYRWTLLQTATDPLFAMVGTNIGVYYLRQNAIGFIAGTPTQNFRTSSTHDAVAANVGTQMPQSIVEFSNYIYFTDMLGRPYRMAIGGKPEPIWLNMRSIIDASTTAYPGVTKYTTTAAFEPTLNLYIVAIWAPVVSQRAPPLEAYAFDAATGSYMGRWKIGVGVQLDCLGTLLDSNGRGVFIALGSKVAPSGVTTATGGFVWAMNSLATGGDFLATESPTITYLTTEDAVAVSLTTEGTAGNWLDNGLTPTISATTSRVGYSATKVMTVDRATVLAGSLSPCTVSMQTAGVAQVVEGTPTPSTVQDGINRLIVGCNGVQGRGLEVTVSPTQAATQWNLQSVTIDAVLSTAGPEEP